MPGDEWVKRGVIPERTEVRKCVITEETIRDGRPPPLLTEAEVEKGPDDPEIAEIVAARGESA